MDSRINIELKINYEKPFFYAGEPLTGQIIVQNKKSILIQRIFIGIILIQKWQIIGEEYLLDQRKIGTIELDLNKISCLSIVDGVGYYAMKAGTNKIHIKIKMTEDLDPCFEYPLGNKYAFLRYKLNVKFVSPSIKINSWNFFLRVFSRPNINNKRKCLNKSVSKTLKKWGLFNIGTTTLTVSIPDNNFRYDDSNFKIIIHIDNNNGKETTKEIKVKLTRLIEFYNKNNQIRDSEEIEIASKNILIAVGPRSKQYLDVSLPLREEDTTKYIYNDNNPSPYDLIMEDINYYMPTLFSGNITCKYELSVSLNFNCLVPENSLPKITFPIYIVHQSPFEYEMEIQKEKLLKNSVDNMFNFNKNKVDNNQFKNNFYENKNGKLENNFNYDENAPAPLIGQKNFGIGLNIINPNQNNINFQNNNINNFFMNNNIINNNNGNKSKIYTNSSESININGGNNINYNFNINISNNSNNSNNKDNKKNNIYTNNNNDNYFNNIEEDEKFENEIKDFDNEKDDENEIENIKESNFSLF